MAGVPGLLIASAQVATAAYWPCPCGRTLFEPRHIQFTYKKKKRLLGAGIFFL
jgi:hypothetical protein